MFESLGHGIFMEKFGSQDKGRTSQLPYLAVASVMKSFSWDPSFTLVVMSETICPPWGNKRAEGVPGSPQGGSWGSWPGSHRVDILPPLFLGSGGKVLALFPPYIQDPQDWVRSFFPPLSSHPIFVGCITHIHYSASQFCTNDDTLSLSEASASSLRPRPAAL